jgi:hypothetical protein
VTSGVYRRIASVFAAMIAAIGFGILVKTALHGGGTSGFIIGALFVGLGSGRLYLLLRRRS